MNEVMEIHQEWKQAHRDWVDEFLMGKTIKCKDGFEGKVVGSYWIYSESFWLVMEDEIGGQLGRPLIPSYEEDFKIMAIPDKIHWMILIRRLKLIEDKRVMAEALE